MTTHPNNALAWHRSMISIVAAAGAFIVSGISIFCGYKLFEIGATGELNLLAQSKIQKIAIFSTAPGLTFALFGFLLGAHALNKLIGSPKPQDIWKYAAFILAVIVFFESTALAYLFF